MNNPGRARIGRVFSGIRPPEPLQFSPVRATPAYGVREVKRSSETRHSSVVGRSTARLGGWILLAGFLLGTSLGISAYLGVFSRLRLQSRISVTVPGLPAGGTGYVYISVSGATPPGALVSGRLEGSGVSCEAPLSALGTAVLSFPLQDVPPGPAHLVIHTGDLTARRQVQIQPTDQLRLWVATAATGGGTKISALARVHPARPRGDPPQRRLSFRLAGPGGSPVACEDVLTDAHGMACFSLTLDPTAPTGRYTLTASLGWKSLAARLSLGSRAEAAAQETPARLVPESGVLVAGLENRCYLDGEAVSFPVEVSVESLGVTRTLAGSAQSVALLPTSSGSPLIVTLRGKDAQGVPFQAKQILPVRQESALICRPVERRVTHGEPLAVELLSGDKKRREYVVELLSGDTVVGMAAGIMESGRGQGTIMIPDNLLGDVWLRAWPIVGRPAESVTWTRVTVRGPGRTRLSLRHRPDGTLVLHNAGSTAADCYVLSGDTAPRSYVDRPDSLRNVPFQVSFTVHDPAVISAPRYARFWAGFILFMASIPLLRSVTAILRRLRRGGFFTTVTLTVLLYLVTTMNYRLFGTAVLAVGLFWIHQSFRGAFRRLSPTGRLTFRWAVPILCVAPYVHLPNAHQIPTQPKAEAIPSRRAEAAPATVSGSPETIADSARIPVGPGESRSADLAEAGGAAFLFGLTADGTEESHHYPFVKRTHLAIQLDFPESLTAGDRGDRISLPLVLSNKGSEAWHGTVRLDGQGGLSCEGGSLPRRLRISPGETWTTDVTIQATAPGTATLSVRWSGTSNGAAKFSAKVLPAGELHRTAWNGLSGNSDTQNRFEARLPSGALYDASELTARLFPGPKSHILTIMKAAPEQPWSRAERNLAVAHAACLGIASATHTKEAVTGENQVRSTLASALLDLLRFQGPDGAFSDFPGVDRIAFTAQAALLFDDLRRIWPVEYGALARARAFLATQVRADGTFRAGNLRRPPTGEETLKTCLVVCALAEETPEAARAFLEAAFRDTGDPIIAAALLAAMRLSGTRSQTAAEAAVRHIETATFDAGARSIDAVAWRAYGLAASGARPEFAQRALAKLSLRRNPDGAFPTLLTNQLFLRTVLLCTRRGPRLTRNVFRFVVNDHPREPQGIDRTVPDAPRAVDLTEALHMENNVIRVETQGSALTPYQVIFSYALPWVRTADDSAIPFDLKVTLPSKAVSVGRPFPLTLTAWNRTGQHQKHVRILLRLPPVLALERLPSGLRLLAGTGRAGEAMLLATGSVPAGQSVSYPIEVVPVAAGTAYMQPALAMLGSSQHQKAASPHTVVVVH